MRILNVISSLDPVHGGMAEGLRQSVQATALLGQREDVLTMDAPDAPFLADFPGQVHALGPVGSTFGYTPLLQPWLNLHAHRYDALVVHGLWQFHGLAVRRAARRARRPYFVYCHGMLDPWFKREYPLKHLKKWLYWPWADYRVLRDAAAVLFTAEDEAHEAAKSFWLYRARAAVVGYGLNPMAEGQAATADALYQAFPDLNGRRLLLFLGRLHPKKGCDLLVEAFAHVAPAYRDLQLVMAGPDSVGWQAELQALAKRLGVADRITWTGMLQGSLKWSALSTAEAFVLPSHQENFGVAVAEALSVGTPVLLSQRVNTWREVTAAGAGMAGPDTFDGTLELLDRWLGQTPTQRQVRRDLALKCFDHRFHMKHAARRYIDTVCAHVGAAHPPRRDVLTAGSQP